MASTTTMTTVDMQRAERIAQAGAAKMTGQGYTFKPARTEGLFWVIKPGGEGKYLANSFNTYCGCPFGQENGICKHSVWLHDELNFAASVDARAAEWMPIDRIA